MSDQPKPTGALPPPSGTESGDSRDISSDQRKDEALQEQAEIIAGLHLQLAAEREKVQMLVDALTRLLNDIDRGINRPSLSRTINAALAKVKAWK